MSLLNVSAVPRRVPVLVCGADQSALAQRLTRRLIVLGDRVDTVLVESSTELRHVLQATRPAFILFGGEVVNAKLDRASMGEEAWRAVRDAVGVMAREPAEDVCPRPVTNNDLFLSDGLEFVCAQMHHAASLHRKVLDGARHFEGENIRLVDLPRDVDDVIRDVVFEGCQLLGPGLLFLRSPVYIRGLVINSPMALWRTEVGGYYTGAIALERVSIIGCDMKEMGICLIEPLYTQLSTMLAENPGVPVGFDF